MLTDLVLLAIGDVAMWRCGQGLSNNYYMPQIGLPETWHALLASGRGGFLPTGEQAVCQGGIGMEELIVSLIKN